MPDISANAGAGMIMYQAAEGGWFAIGGTSLAAPFLAGLAADVDSGCTTDLGAWTPTLYALASHAGAFRDITSGDTDLTGSNGGAYPATVGYDAATGLGSPIPSGLACAQVASVSPASAAPGATVTVSGLGLEGATITIGGRRATVTSETATTAQVVVPSGTGTVHVTASSIEGAGLHSAPFTYSEPQCVVPNVKGKTLAAAKRAITAAHCAVGKVTRSTSRTIKKGRVISQKPKPHSRLKYDTRINFIVSKGPSGPASTSGQRGPDVIAHDSTLTIEGADLYLFGLLHSAMWMA